VKRSLPSDERQGHEALVVLHLARATEELEQARAHALLAGIQPRAFDRMIRQQYELRNDPARSLEVH
jgi:hypothetical protein